AGPVGVQLLEHRLLLLGEAVGEGGDGHQHGRGERTSAASGATATGGIGWTDRGGAGTQHGAGTIGPGGGALEPFGPSPRPPPLTVGRRRRCVRTTAGGGRVHGSNDLCSGSIGP